MSGIACDRARELLALGDPGGQAHARECAGCRREALRITTVLEFLAEAPVVDPPDALDLSVRRALEAPAPGTLITTLRPATAISLGIASLLALVTAVGIPLAAAGMGRTGPVVAALAVVTYMLLSGAVTLPLLVNLSLGRGGNWRFLR